MLIASLPVIAL